MDVRELQPAVRGGSSQHAIRPLDPAVLDELHLTGVLAFAGDFADADVGIRGGAREVSARGRIGQTLFRRAMFARYGEACAVLGPLPRQVLDAAHLYAYADTPRHDVRGGLLFRKDLHRLFDEGLLLIDARTWTVRIAPELRCHPEYARLGGQVLRLRRNVRPEASYLWAHARLSGWWQPARS